jgi:7,8-dihydropterin-6-yl-methyl-4-(beta-D-ribofuranosyl)aminobenzene 5'-phosphate synthase
MQVAKFGSKIMGVGVQPFTSRYRYIKSKLFLMVKVSILCDNAPGRHMLSEHGLSYHIETNEATLLLDAGASDVFLQNARKMDIDIGKVDAVILSHGHWDHGNGLPYLPKGLPLFAHPAVFKKRFHRGRENSYVGLGFEREFAMEHFDLTLIDSPVVFGNTIHFLGAIPRVNDFESKKTAFVDEVGAPDFVPDDSGVAIETAQGLIVISGCAHAGIVNTVQHARNITGISTVRAVMGGFHLKQNDDITRRTINELKKLQVKQVFPAHCTDLPAMAMFFEAFGSKRICTGDEMIFD